MAEFEIQAGLKFATTTPEEMAAMLEAWRTELHRGVKFRHVTIAATFGSTWTYVPSKPGDDMPDSGMSWKVKNVAVAGGGFVEGTDTFDYFLGDISPTRVIATGVTRQDRPDIVLNPNEGLAFSGVATGTGQIFISMMVIEVPYTLAGGVLA